MVEDSLLSIERAGPDDVEGILEVERACFGRTWTREQYASELSGLTASHPVLARLAGRVVAFGSITCTAGQAYIPTLGVLPTHRGTGLGGRVLDAMLAHARAEGCVEVVLEVRSRNTIARRLYEGRGFVVVGIRRAYYEDPFDDAVVMRLRMGEGNAVAG
ncbi:MAG: ribosomal protein S18-alanine N-acetyltransferase [Armatimonadetes bacterium]|nr:ribosomal protein S18-alanine N-acetyltransferase [Armatimonadota bacterium]